MSPKTISNNENSEELDQQSSSNENKQINLTIDNSINHLTDSDLNLGWILKEDLINSFTKFSSFLSGRSIKPKDKRVINENNNHLLKRISILSSGDKLNELKCNLDLIDKNLSKDLDKNEDGLFFKLDWNERSNIMNLLTKNFYAIVLYSDSVCEEDKKDLIKENNKLIQLLSNLIAIRPLPLDSYSKKNDNAQGNSNCSSIKFIIINFLLFAETDDHPSENSEIDITIENIIKKFDELDQKFKDYSSENSKRVLQLEAKASKSNSELDLLGFVVEKLVEQKTKNLENLENLDLNS